MNLRPRLFDWRYAANLLLLAVLTWAAIHQLTQPLWDEPEIVLEMGGTYEDLRRNSSAPFSPEIRGHIWFGIPMTDARLRFVDPQFGFTTPAARFFTVDFDDNVIYGIRMSPQVEPLLIDDALKVVLDLQDQWREKGWVAKGLRRNPTIADTPEWRAWLRKGILHGQSNWQAGDKYQVMLVLGRFEDYRNPTEERYLITLALAKPWTPFDEIEDMYDEPSHFPAPQPN
ncbi:hypothetical protein [Pseudomonas lini]|uniref:Uncharacterized protein n=1 Tax=Pseudomonas lini TaxID=163011 RepID=A0A0J6H442_9PSED|nr:hypothetical protein [Pseudomonas lini]KAB0504972.1 hypothetical protein F7R14_10725 [Pseudomonas lini]KMM91801.1 hypothetical protein TU81_17880 [Pseudomonas lini]KNH46151.1 hypothetical protein ACS73_12110 [Pseudomonas lini]NSX11176.1 hypothetical protein [Pseudomonas lini]SDR95678.1 hypothetical protein SAMN04490191_0364 [Pseudomonas lini]